MADEIPLRRILGFIQVAERAFRVDIPNNFAKT
jgi:hypothetical protein